MKPRYYVVRLLTNSAGQDGSTISVIEGETEKAAKSKAQVNYHHTLEIYHNAPDVLYAVVELENVMGNTEIMEIVDHRPEPEPEPDEDIEE